MELLSVSKARSIWSIELAELNPRGKKLDGQLIGWLQEKYSFSKVPSSLADLDETKALSFLDGGFVSSAKDVVAFDLKIYGDGLVIDSRSSTEENDRFLHDMLRHAARDLGLEYTSKMIHKRLYISELIVRIKDLIRLNPKLKTFTKKFSALLDKDFDISSISFSPELKPGEPPTHFRLERRINTPFSEDKYFVSAPLQTKDHIKLLEEFETLLAG